MKRLTAGTQRIRKGTSEPGFLCASALNHLLPVRAGMKKRVCVMTDKGGFRQRRVGAWMMICCLMSALATISSGQSSRTPGIVELINNQPFPVRMPLRVRGYNLGQGAWAIADRQPVQQTGSDVVFVADVNASSSRRFAFQQDRRARPSALLRLRSEGDSVALHYGDSELGRMSWDIVLRRVERARPQNAETESTRADFHAGFRALPMSFHRDVEGVVFDVWRADATKDNLRLIVELHAYHAGFLDINAQLINQSAANTTNVYAAVVCRWQQPTFGERAGCYDNRIEAFGRANWTSFRVPTPGAHDDQRHLMIQRGVDWIRTRFAHSASALWMHDFAESFTVREAATDRRPARYIGANVPQLGQEAQTVGVTLYSITEITREQIRSYADRFMSNVLPAPGEPLAFASRLVFDDGALTNTRADEIFIAYAGYAEQRRTSEAVRISIGVPGVRFGTNYFPYSTLGENFGFLKLPGMDRAAYWPLAADTVTHWRLFADDIRRDLRIAKAMGFELIRLHHFELLAPLEQRIKEEYLDFLFGEMRHLGLRALLDAQMRPEEVAGWVARYRDSVHGVEIENEVLIFGINDGRERYWNAVYDAVKRVAPDMPVHLTGHTNTGAFTRLDRLGVRYDRIGQHAYMDSIHAIPSARGFALAAANYAREAGKPPVITEWNWRGLTRMTPEARARLYAPIFENVLRTRSMPEIYQFQFTESLAMDPQTLRGIRHYEPLWLSRRPKPEAFELMRLIEEYSLPTNSTHVVRIEHAVVNLDSAGRGTAQFRVTNRQGQPVNLRAAVETSSNVSATLRREDAAVRLAPNATITVPVTIEVRPTQGGRAEHSTANVLPGFYHIFLRLEGEGGFLHYGWAEARFAGAPPIDRTTPSDVRYGDGALTFDFNRPLAVVYGDGAPILELEAASAVVNTLESATGRPVAMYHLPDLPADVRARGSLIAIGTANTNALVASVMNHLPTSVAGSRQFVARATGDQSRGDWLVIGGTTPEDVELAAMDLTVRYWKFAKDSAARRIGLVARELPRGGDPALLP